MSGRAYAKHHNGEYGGGSNIHAFITHKFKLKAPQKYSKAKENAIRR
jgi:hypothetical protein